jgi:hypothetical protein
VAPALDRRHWKADRRRRKVTPPTAGQEPRSNFAFDHVRLYTARSLLQEIEEALPLAGYRIRWLKENDDGFDYSVPPRTYATGCFEIELVLEKIAIPDYADRLVYGDEARLAIDVYVAIIKRLLCSDSAMEKRVWTMAASLPLPPYPLLQRELKRQHPFMECPTDKLKKLLGPFVREAQFSEEHYASRYSDLRGMTGLHEHFIRHGYFEGREAHPSGIIFG